MKYIHVHIQNVLHEYKETHNKVHHSSTIQIKDMEKTVQTGANREQFFLKRPRGKLTAELSTDTTCSSAHGKKKIFNVLQENTAKLEVKTQPKKINKIL